MPKRPPPIARVRLARSTLRLLGPWLLSAVVLAVGVASALLSGGTVGVVLAAVAGVLLVVALAAMAALRSIHLEVEESAIRVGWLGGHRIYPLVAGPVTRVRLRGQGASDLRTRFGPMGVGYGSAVLRGDEKIDIERLAPTATAILVPTAHGRLAICAAREEQLLDALSEAAHARQRLDVAAPPPVEEAEAADVPQEAESDAAQPELEDAPALTGIERALLEQGLADEGAAAAAEPGGQAAQPEHQVEPTAPEVEPEAAPEAEVIEAPPVAPPVAQRRRLGRPRWPRQTARLRVRPPRPAAALVLLPLVGAGAAWGIGRALGHLPDPASDLGRLTALALVMAGPAASLGALMARHWWPRLVGVVVAGGLASSVFIGRALFGA